MDELQGGAPTKPLTLNALCAGIVTLPAEADIPVTFLTMDSRRVVPGAVFLAVPGQVTGSCHYVRHAITQGARCVLVDAEPEQVAAELAEVPVDQCIVLPVPGLSLGVGQLFSRFYGTDKMAMPVIGVTGTNGKTSVTYFISALLKAVQQRPQGLVGTTGTGLLGEILPSLHTTPGVEIVHELMAHIASASSGSLSMEVSSHALEQGRVDAVSFTGAVFTNLSRDHLDYHETMEAYALAKKRLVTQAGLRWVVVNVDDDTGLRWLPEITAERVIRYGLSPDADLTAEQLTYTSAGISGKLCWQGEAEAFAVMLFGEFNVYNLLAAVGAVLGMGYPLKAIVSAFDQLMVVPGRMEPVVTQSSEELPAVLVDYAHTPDALEKALMAARAHQTGALWCVFGCGGDRDRGKRSLMGGIAARCADQVVVTSDNPRSEEPLRIIEEIVTGLKSQPHISIEPDRACAIRQAIGRASSSDIVMIAGKGHENYQEVKGVRHPFDDAEVARAALQDRSVTQMREDR